MSVDALTPLQCFVAGLAATLVVCSILGFFGWRYYNTLLKRDPEFFAKVAAESKRQRERKQELEDEGFHLRRREVELLERVVENQEVMIGLLRQLRVEETISQE